MNKSLLTNIISCLILIIGYFAPFHGNLILITGSLFIAAEAREKILGISKESYIFNS